MSTLEFNALKLQVPAKQMNMQEFCAKVQQSSAQKQTGQTIAMQANESSEDFINRLLCI